MQSMTQKQAALLLIVAGILKDGFDANDPKARKLDAAAEEVAFELAALGITAPDIATPPRA